MLYGIPSSLNNIFDLENEEDSDEEFDRTNFTTEENLVQGFHDIADDYNIRNSFSKLENMVNGDSEF